LLWPRQFCDHFFEHSWSRAPKPPIHRPTRAVFGSGGSGTAFTHEIPKNMAKTTQSTNSFEKPIRTGATATRIVGPGAGAPSRDFRTTSMTRLSHARTNSAAWPGLVHFLCHLDSTGVRRHFDFYATLQSRLWINNPRNRNSTSKRLPFRTTENHISPYSRSNLHPRPTRLRGTSKKTRRAGRSGPRSWIVPSRDPCQA